MKVSNLVQKPSKNYFIEWVLHVRLRTLRAPSVYLRENPCLLTRHLTPVHVQKLDVESDFTCAHRMAEVNAPQHKRGQKQKNIRKQIKTNIA